MEPAGALESRQGEVYAVIGAFFPIALAAVSLRLYSRIRFSYIGADDVLIVLAMVCSPRPSAPPRSRRAALMHLHARSS